MRFLTRLPLWLLLVTLAVGCASSQEPASLDTTVPYLILYDGSMVQAKEEVRYQLGRQGWGVLNSDPQLVAATKRLRPHEMGSSKVVTRGMIGGGAGQQTGRITFSFSEENPTQIRMRARIAKEGVSMDQKGGTEAAQRRHPLMVKMGRLFHRHPDFALRDPPPSWIGAR